MYKFTELVVDTPDDVVVLGMNYNESRALELLEIVKEVTSTHPSVKALQFWGDEVNPTLITVASCSVASDEALDEVEAEEEWDFTKEGWRVGRLIIDKWRQGDLEFYHKNSYETFHILFNLSEDKP